MTRVSAAALVQWCLVRLDPIWPVVATLGRGLLAGVLTLVALCTALAHWLLVYVLRLPLLFPLPLRRRREALLAALADWRHEARRGVERWVQSLWDRLTNRYGTRRVQRATVVTLLVVLIVSCVGGTVTILPHLAGAQTSHTPNTLARFRATGDAWEHGRAPFQPTNVAKPSAGKGKGPDAAPPSVGTPTSHPYPGAAGRAAHLGRDSAARRPLDVSQ